MRYLTVSETLELHIRIMEQSSGTVGIRSLSALESALIQPRMNFGGKELYPSMVEKASALSYSIIKNHPFVDGNKRTGHAAMEVFLLLNGFEISASTEEQEQVILRLASGELERDKFTDWLRAHVVEKT